MRAGQLCNLCTLQKASTGQDAIGQPLTTWEDVEGFWGDIRHTGGLEAIKAGASTSTVRASIRRRYRTGIHSGMRVTSGGTTYNIVAVLPDAAGREYLDLVCEVVT
jgi:SPP1 family predicted phage head-tail adaptor